jgi:ABC-type transporter lipoprotein component MlaA
LGSAVNNTGLSPWFYIDPVWIAYAARGLDFVQQRAQFLHFDKSVDEAFDPYLFVRDSYLQNRSAKIRRVLNPVHDENAPPLSPGADVALQHPEEPPHSN